MVTGWRCMLPNERGGTCRERVTHRGLTAGCPGPRSGAGPRPLGAGRPRRRRGGGHVALGARCAARVQPQGGGGDLSDAQARGRARAAARRGPRRRVAVRGGRPGARAAPAPSTRPDPAVSCGCARDSGTWCVLCAKALWSVLCLRARDFLVHAASCARRPSGLHCVLCMWTARGARAVRHSPADCAAAGRACERAHLCRPRSESAAPRARMAQEP